MTKKEFMDYADIQISSAYMKFKTNIFNLLDKAWAEGKRNAEIDGVVTIVKDAFEKMSIEKEEQTLGEWTAGEYPKE